MATLRDKEGNHITWLNATIKAISAIGHPTPLQDIYQAVRNEIDIATSGSKDVEATVRNAIYKHTEDSDVKDKGENIFYKESNGVWGLVNDNILKIDEDDVLDDEDTDFPEGRAVEEMHKRRERNSKLVIKAKKHFAKNHNGQLYCEICHFNFEEVYGKAGEGFIEAHHIKPVSKMKADDKTKVEDLVMLCPNCHRMVHRIRPWIDNKEDLRNILIRK